MVGGVFGQGVHPEPVQGPVGALVGVAAQRLPVVAHPEQARLPAGPQPPGLVAQQREGAGGAVGFAGPGGGGAVGQLAHQPGGEVEAGHAPQLVGHHRGAAPTVRPQVVEYAVVGHGAGLQPQPQGIRA